MENVAVRFCSKTKSGNTKRIAIAIAEGAGVKAISISDEPKLSEKVDVLFLGGAPYANIMAPELKKYAESLTPETVGKVVLFTTSNWSRRTVRALRKMLKEKGIEVAGKYFYAQVFNIAGRLDAARKFGEKMKA
jgi:flavorubredoxin